MDGGKLTGGKGIPLKAGRAKFWDSHAGLLPSIIVIG